jgi:hypothetical protein
MNRPLAAIWLVALVAVFAIFAVSMQQDSPEPLAIPPTNAAVPLSSTETAQGDVIRVFVENLPPYPFQRRYSLLLQPTRLSRIVLSKLEIFAKSRRRSWS